MNELKKQGLIIKFEDDPYTILKSQHARTAQRRAFVRTTLKNLITGKTTDRTFNASDRFEEAETDKIKTNFLYQKGEDFYFMNLETFEEISLSADNLGEQKDFLKEGLEISILYFEGKPISIQLPQKIVYKVVEAPPAVRGDTQGSTLKTVVLENGLKIDVPFFIKTDEEIIINTETGKYVERK